MTKINKEIEKILIEQISEYLSYKKTRQAKVVIYTAVSENYDYLIQHTYISKEYDYVCFSDQEIKNPGIWEIRPMEDTNLDLIRKSKYYKVFPNKYFSNYEYSIWLDTNIGILNDTLSKRVNELINNNQIISVNIHFERDCIYQEAKTCIDLQKDNPEEILNEVKFLKKEKYPKNNGLFEDGIIFRKHNDPKIIKLMKDWWWMISNFSRRDQLSFNYVLYKNNIKCEKLFPITARLMDGFIFKAHNTKIVSTLYVDTKNGFDDNDFIQIIIVISDNKFDAHFDLKEFSEIKQLQFSLLINQYCQLKIDNIYLKNSVNIEKIDASKIKYTTNGILLENDYVNFNTSNPKIIFPIKNKPESITI